jgi:hypothetical protein
MYATEFFEIYINNKVLRLIKGWWLDDILFGQQRTIFIVARALASLDSPRLAPPSWLVEQKLSGVVIAFSNL